jgi:CheY-like chemotaxis protein
MKQRRCVLIEDNEQNRYLVTFLLERNGYEVLSAIDGRAGIELALSTGNSADVILLDIQLPTLHGHDVARALRNESCLDNVPIIAVTSYAMVGDREAVLEAGCDGYIEKPINPETFVTEIETFMSSRPRSGT